MRHVENALHTLASWLSQAAEWLDLFAIWSRWFCNWCAEKEGLTVALGMAPSKPKKKGKK